MFLTLAALVALAPAQKPAMRDFIGLNVHTVQFKPDLYRPTTSVVRDYHGIDWDLGDDPNQPATFPMSRNNVNWQTLYGGWQKDGYRIDVTAQFGGIKQDKWTPANASAYGEAFSRYFGPSGDHPLVEAMEIGNEPADYDEPHYRTVFENMAKGVRKGDPKMKIATCAVNVGTGDKYSKDVACLNGLESLIDVVNVHTYPFAEVYPTWRRSYPEDPSIEYLKQAQKMIDWRDQHAPKAQLWITEFGYDSTTKPNHPTGDFAKWQGNTDEEQAEYIVRSYLLFSSMNVDRAYLYYFNDEDEPQLHGSSGLTRNFVPKPSFYAVAHLQKTLGDYRFEKSLIQTPKAYVFQYKCATNPRSSILVAWSPTGSKTTSSVTLPALGGKIVRAEQMPLDATALSRGSYAVNGTGSVTLSISEKPMYLWVERS